MRYFCLVLFFLVGLGLLARATEQNVENKVQQLSRLNKDTRQSEADIQKILKICYEIHSRYPDLVLEHLEKLKPQIEEGKYYSCWVDYVGLIQEIYTGQGNLRDAEKIIGDIYGQYAQKLSQEEKVDIRLNLVYLSINLGETEKSQAIIREILPHARTDFQKANLYRVRGFNYRNEGNYKQAAKDCLKALDMYAMLKDTMNIAAAYDQLGMIYREMKDYERAIFYMQKALNLARKSGNYRAEMNASVNIGANYRSLKQIDSALYYYNLSIAVARQHNRQQSLAQNLMNIANIYSEEYGNYSEAEKYYRQSLGICYSAGITYGIYLNWYNLANNYKLRKEFSRAKAALDSAAVYAAVLKMPSEDAIIHEGYYELYKAQGDFGNALKHYEKFNELIREIRLEASRKEVAEIQARYDLAVKDKEIERINNEFQKKKNRNRLLLIGLSAVIMLAGVIISFLIYRNKSLRLLYDRNIEMMNSFNIQKSQVAVAEPVSEDSLKAVYDKLLVVLEKDKIFKNPYLSIADVAEAVKSNEKYVSAATATYGKMNFSNFINFYRINEARQLIYDGRYSNLNEIMQACGFNSRTTFYTAFQKHTGMSPRQFKSMAASQKTEEA